MGTGGGILRVRMPVDDDGPADELGLSQLAERSHGSWYFHCAVPVLPGRRERLAAR
jgi:hypothetical protein